MKIKIGELYYKNETYIIPITKEDDYYIGFIYGLTSKQWAYNYCFEVKEQRINFVDMNSENFKFSDGYLAIKNLIKQIFNDEVFFNMRMK